jgi:hypothetical protein
MSELTLVGQTDNRRVFKMNVIWKENKSQDGGSAQVELVFTPNDVIQDINEPIVIGISVSRLRKNSKN